MKRAYRKLALYNSDTFSICLAARLANPKVSLCRKFHPDKHAGAGAERQAEAERQFKEVGEAYAVLSNQESRQRYDAGGFVGDIADFLPGGKSFDPKQMFEVFQKMQAGQGGRVFTGEMS